MKKSVKQKIISFNLFQESIKQLIITLINYPMIILSLHLLFHFNFNLIFLNYLFHSIFLISIFIFPIQSNQFNYSF